MKDANLKAFYFPHDCNAIQDPKIMTLLAECGLAGVGMFWVIIEILHQQEDGKITEEEFKNYIKFYCHFQGQGEHLLNKIEQVLISSKLLTLKDGFIYSERVMKNKAYRTELSEKRSYAGKKSAELRLNSTSVQQVFSTCQQSNEIKGNKIKEVIIEIPPKMEDVVAYCKERGNGVDVNKWFNHYQSKGWLIGKNKMKDWKASVRTWEQTDAERKPKVKYV